MGLFICEKCFCVENTATGSYWTKNALGQALCSECDEGEWHGRFEKTFPTIEQIKSGEGDAYHYLNRDKVLKILVNIINQI